MSVTADLAGNVMFVLIVVTGGDIVHHSVILHINPYAAVSPVGIFVLTTIGTMLIKRTTATSRQLRGSRITPRSGRLIPFV